MNPQRFLEKFIDDTMDSFNSDVPVIIKRKIKEVGYPSVLALSLSIRKEVHRLLYIKPWPWKT